MTIVRPNMFWVLQSLMILSSNNSFCRAISIWPNIYFIGTHGKNPYFPLQGLKPGLGCPGLSDISLTRNISGPFPRQNRYRHDEYKESRSADQFSFTTHGQEREGEEKEWFLKKEGAHLCVTHKMCHGGKVLLSDSSCHKRCRMILLMRGKEGKSLALGFQCGTTYGSNEGTHASTARDESHGCNY